MHLLNPRLCQSITRALTQMFIVESYPKEAPHFELIWEQFVKQKPDVFWRSEAVSVSDLSRLGLGVEGKEARGFVSPFAMITVAAALSELRAGKPESQPKELEGQLRVLAVATGLPTAIADRLAMTVGPTLRELSRQVEELLVSSVTTPSEPGKPLPEEPALKDVIYVERLWEGRHTPTKVYIDRYAKSLPARQQYDVVVDEIDHELRLQGGKPEEIHDIAAMRRGMLWLVLTHVGGYVEHADIRRLFDMAPGAECYQYRNQLGDLLGEKLLKRVMPEGGEKRYVIPKTGWSFCWLRLVMDPRRSELLYRIPRPVK